MKYQTYPAYKDSGVEWFSKIPEHWFPTRLKFESSINMGQSPNSEDCNQDGYGMPFLQGNAEFGFRSPTPKQYCDIPRKIANEGELLFSVRAPVGALNIADQKYGIGRGLCALASKESVNSHFLWWLIPVVKSELNAVSTGSTFEAVSAEQVENVVFFRPTFSEQQKIAQFLDHETAKIDTLIEKQQRLIELLKEKRQAVISHAVTKGLNPHAPMKDSGVEWLGEVPEGWEVSRIGFYANKIGSGKTPRGGSEIYQDEGILFLRSQNVYDDGLRINQNECVYISCEIHEEMKNTSVKTGDVLLNITGGSIGRTCLVYEEIEANVNQHVCILRFSKNINEYLSYVMKADVIKYQIESCQTGGNREGLNFEQIAKLIVPIPPECDRLEILNHIKLSIKKYEELVDKANSAIELMQERRTALISAAVTGKIDVRNWGEFMNRQQALNALIKLKPELVKRFGVTRLALFGSTVRDEARPESDIDIVVAFDSPATSAKYFGVQFYLEDELGVPVDLVTEKAMRPELRPFIEREAINV